MVLRSHHRNDQFKKIGIPSVEDNFAYSCFLTLNIPLFLEKCNDVLSSLIKSPYKTYFLNKPYFMRVRKRFDAEKIRKIG
jgi:hypothetical protein